MTEFYGRPVYFCSDAILRFRSDYDDTTAVPLLSIQNARDKDSVDPYFLLRFFRHEVFIEKGTTLLLKK